MLRIDIKPLKPGLHTFDWACEPEALDLDPAVFSRIEVEARLDVHPSRVLVAITASAVASLVCDRTLVPFEQAIEGTCDVLFAPPEFIEGNEDEDEGIRVLLKDQEEIDLVTDARDTLMLALPQRRIAPGAEDIDIQTRFGDPGTTDPDIDPRWEALRQLRPEDEAGNDDQPAQN